jgi:hypothetical protein
VDLPPGVPRLAELLAADPVGGDDRQRLRGLVARARQRTPLKVLNLDPSSSYTEAVRHIVDKGWSFNSQCTVRMVPPIDWGVAPDEDANSHFVLNSLRPAAPFLMAADGDGMSEGLERMTAIALDWLRYNLVEDRPNTYKWYDHAVGYRGHYIAALLDRLLRTPDPDLTTVTMLVWALQRHADFLGDPTNRSCSNHMLYMMLGLGSTCRVVPELADCERLTEYAHTEIGTYLESTVSSEWLSLEHSPRYQIYVGSSLCRLAETDAFTENLAVPGGAMLSLAHWMYHPNGDTVLIGDSAGRLSSGLHDFTDYAQTEGAQGREPPSAPAVFPEAGVAVFRTPWSQAPFSEHSFLYFTASYHSDVHKHSDDFTFEWSSAGVPILVDSGTRSMGSTSHGLLTWRTDPRFSQPM